MLCNAFSKSKLNFRIQFEYSSVKKNTFKLLFRCCFKLKYLLKYSTLKVSKITQNLRHFDGFSQGFYAY
jgi:hypothetical protein